MGNILPLLPKLPAPSGLAGILLPLLVQLPTEVAREQNSPQENEFGKRGLQTRWTRVETAGVQPSSRWNGIHFQRVVTSIPSRIGRCPRGFVCSSLQAISAGQLAGVVIPSVSKWLGRGGHGPHSSNVPGVPAPVGPQATAGVGRRHKPLPDRRDEPTGTWQVPPGWHIQRSGEARGWTASPALHGVRAQSRVLRAGDLCAERGTTSQAEASECKTKARKGQPGHGEKFRPMGPLDVRAKKLASDPGSHPCF